ncbi:hypothetical protein CCICO_10975 [Corynebacterium ciconiae DSM 44920]|uniref:DoxX family protein n=1 Tax=Corynebacterium ciconiae TaxID=227319 RepID=UPI0003761926|nr:DoxX family protein [Corynebacterium ciconiae]WKD62190.1 hypothetical protein CCICO_10975 [Corynebacterium ciconiae DSM 44920]
MILVPTWWIAPAFLAAVLLVDAILSLRPPAFIAECLRSVHFPEDWWWVLIVVKLLAAVGLIAGIWIPGLAAAATAGVIAYFSCAIWAHIRAGATGMAFRVNCLGMWVLSCVTMVCVLV